MNRNEVIALVSSKIRMIRLENEYSQEKMAEVLGISKKTLVQIEKGRTLSGWTVVVAIVSLFRDSQSLKLILGEDPFDVIEIIAHNEIVRTKEKTMGGKIWWEEIDKKHGFLLQQNVVSQHYRIIDEHHYRLFSSFDKEETMVRFAELCKLKEEM